MIDRQRAKKTRQIWTKCILKSIKMCFTNITQIKHKKEIMGHHWNILKYTFYETNMNSFPSHFLFSIRASYEFMCALALVSSGQDGFFEGKSEKCNWINKCLAQYNYFISVWTYNFYLCRPKKEHPIQVNKLCHLSKLKVTCLNLNLDPSWKAKSSKDWRPENEELKPQWKI